MTEAAKETGVTSIYKNFTEIFQGPSKGTTNSGFFGAFSGTSGIANSFTNTFSSQSSTTSTIGQIATYLLAVIVILLFVAIAIHLFIKPIFQLHPGGPGIIPVPGGDDGIVFWSKGDAGEILEEKLPIRGSSWGYSLILDTFIQNTLQFSTNYRILFSRGAVRSATPTGNDTLIGILDTYNLVVGLKPDTNDMIVSVLSGSAITKNEENIIISNVPVQQPFRLGIIVMEHALEVYINGHLVKTRKYDYSLKSVTGPIEIAKPTEASIAKFQLLKIWNRVLTTSEMRYAKPDLVTSTPRGALPMPSIGSC